MRASVLLIDDNAIQAATRQTILKRAGYFVIAVLKPERALEQFRRASSRADRACDHRSHYAGHDGVRVCASLRDTHPTLPVLVISGLEEAEGSMRA